MNRDDVIKMLDNAKTGDIMVVSWIDNYELNEVVFKYDGYYQVVGLDFIIHRSWVKTTNGEIRPKTGKPNHDYVNLNENKNLRFPTAEEKTDFLELIRKAEKKDALITVVVMKFDSKQIDVIQMYLPADKRNPSEISRRINDMCNKEHIAWMSNICEPEKEIVFNFFNDDKKTSFTLKNDAIKENN